MPRSNSLWRCAVPSSACTWKTTFLHIGDTKGFSEHNVLCTTDTHPIKKKFPGQQLQLHTKSKRLWRCSTGKHTVPSFLFHFTWRYLTARVSHCNQSNQISRWTEQGAAGESLFRPDLITDLLPETRTTDLFRSHRDFKTLNHQDLKFPSTLHYEGSETSPAGVFGISWPLTTSTMCSTPVIHTTVNF